MLHDDFPPPRWREVVMSAQGIVDSREEIGEENFFSTKEDVLWQRSQQSVAQ